MRQIIDGLVYDTSKAELIAQDEERRLYGTCRVDRRFFFHVLPGLTQQERLEALTREEALDWATDPHLGCPRCADIDKLIAAFGLQEA